MIQEISAWSLVVSDKGSDVPKAVASRGGAEMLEYSFALSQGEEPESPERGSSYSRAEFALLELFVRARAVGEPGSRAVDVRRALLTNLLITDSERTRVVVDRHELGRLFDRYLDDIAWEVFAPRLQLCDFLEDAIEYLQVATAQTSERTGGWSPCICWFTTPDVDFDVVLQTLQHARNHQFAGLVLGSWPHGPAVYVLEDTTRPHGLELVRGTPTMTEEEAFCALSSCRT